MSGKEWVQQHDTEADIVHGRVTTEDGKTIDHAWVEQADTVIDPTTGIAVDKDAYYRVTKAERQSVYTLVHALVNSIRSHNWGPWTKDEVGDHFLSYHGRSREE